MVRAKIYTVKPEDYYEKGCEGVSEGGREWCIYMMCAASLL
jgi:hypothetical protein